MSKRAVTSRQLTETLFSLSKGIRYVAIYRNGKLISSERPEINNTSSGESDKYEELIVNPTLLKLVTQRGNIDCGGASFVLIRYGNFFEFVRPVKNGHLSVGIELNENVLKIISLIEETLSLSGF
jgi:hypothetical protein